MKTRMQMAGWLLLSAGAALSAQQKAPARPSPAQLELTTEVAAHTAEGYPAVLRVTFRNAGAVAVDLPMPEAPCVPFGGGIQVRFDWQPADPNVLEGMGFSGVSCGVDHAAGLLARAAGAWIRLEPSEFVTVSVSLRANLREIKPGRVTYYAEYTPPEMTAKEREDLERLGYIVPVEMVRSRKQSFAIE